MKDSNEIGLTKHNELFIGYHGCSLSVAETLINSRNVRPKISSNSYDWLGQGFYVWENNIQRAKEFAEEKKQRNGSKEETTIVGVVYSLGDCLDTITKAGLDLIIKGNELLIEVFKKLDKTIPSNKPSNEIDEDFLLRDRDCAVLNFIHQYLITEFGYTFDSVRGVFWEGKELYAHAGFREKNHIQVAIRNPDCIKGFFWPHKQIEFTIEKPNNGFTPKKSK
jgi:hypothetical protein